LVTVNLLFLLRNFMRRPEEEVPTWRNAVKFPALCGQNEPAQMQVPPKDRVTQT